MTCHLLSLRPRINRCSYGLLLDIRCFSASFIHEDAIFAAAVCQFIDIKPALITRNAFERKRQRRGGQRVDVTSRTTYLNSQNEILGKNQNWNSGNPTYVNRLHIIFLQIGTSRTLKRWRPSTHENEGFDGHVEAPNFRGLGHGSVGIRRESIESL